uniref:E3 SUMO-protein ligase SIZ1 isoform X1 n=1 Tax=Tanacetum cinerariifolium TaxID=118510 RepID=A0A6L2MEU6_TANCI|nr:E3 SUMO-protein ligase SIZ1 isoform X1 [Tanacetum cinerariifolium]
MDDDTVRECKKIMARFRIQELKDVLSHLSLPKTGKKQDLTERILALISSGEDQKDKSIQKEDVVTLINDIYRKMMSTGANVPVIRGRGLPDSSSITPKEEIVDQTVRCPCGGPTKTEFMIQCADPQCNVVQHIPCVIIPVNSTDGASPASLHYCEVCRINRCDPFWKTLAHPLYPVKLRVSSTPVDGSPPQLKTETSFLITRANVHMLEKGGYDVQAWCILLNDSVPFRMQWPQYSDLHVNDMFARTISRPGSKMLGANGRDESPSISMYVQEGLNKICLTGSDTRTFCLGVRLVKQRTFQEVISLIPGEKEGESFNEAVSRVFRCIGGGMAAANDDSDSDLEVIADNITINLRCPMSGRRMKIAARFKGCVHLGGFDLHTLVHINERSRKWQCPICLKNYSLEDIIVDPYLNRIAKMMQHCDEDVTEIEVKSDGSWRAKIGRPFMDLERWHLSDGSLCEFDSNMDVLAKASGHQLAMRANGAPDIGLPQGNKLDVYVTDCGQEIISMSSSSSEDMREDDFQSVDNFTHKDSLMDCTPYSNHLQTSVVTNRSSSSSLGEPCVIVLSDSDEENDDVVSAAGVSIPCPPPNGSTSSLTATLDTPDLQLGDAAYPAGSCWTVMSDQYLRECDDMFARTISRPGSKMLGANGRDESPSISMYVQEGLNKICLTGSDTRTFCLGVRLVKQRTFQEVISLIPGEKEGESFNEAVSRVFRCIGGGMAAANDDSDSDLEVIADNITINLRCPMQHCDEDVTEIEVKSDGSWRAKIGRPFMDLERWHLSDGSLCEFDSNMDVLAKASGHQLAMRANGAPDIGLPQGNKLDVYVTDCGQEIISMSSSSSEDMREDDFQSVDNFTHKDSLMDCTPYSNHLQTSVVTNRSSSSSLGEPCVIVLSDSDEENDDVVSAAGVSIPCPPPNGSTSSLTATLDTPDLQLGDAAYPAASTRLNGEAESSQMSDNNGLSVRLTFAGQPKTLSEAFKAESGQMGNKKRPLGDPFTFPRKRRTGWKQSALRDVQHQ